MSRSSHRSRSTRREARSVTGNAFRRRPREPWENPTRLPSSNGLTSRVPNGHRAPRRSPSPGRRWAVKGRAGGALGRERRDPRHQGRDARMGAARRGGWLIAAALAVVVLIEAYALRAETLGVVVVVALAALGLIVVVVGADLVKVGIGAAY